MKPLLVGEDNPHSLDPRMALFPKPEGAAGHRLMRILGYRWAADYLRDFDRTNLCSGRWSATEARVRALDLAEARRPLVLLGAKVARAFGLDFMPFSVACGASLMAILPHPSGRCRIWNDPTAAERARTCVAELLDLAKEVAA